MSEEINKDNFWKKYYALAEGKLPAKILRTTLDKYCPETGEALDVGAGHLVESMFLLEKGFNVTAIDNDPASAELAVKIKNSRFNFIQDTIQHVNISKEHFTLVCALNILSHIPPEDFDFVLNKIQSAIKTGGVFYGNFLGSKDGWNNSKSTKTFLDINRVKDSFKDFDILYIGEREFEDTFGWAQIKGLDSTKHWHIITLITRKK
jgi:cyclopropane fatty-acyl-phospholipid synthase-like methyltransferase